MDYCLQRDVQLDLRGLDVAPGCTQLSHSLEKKTEVAFCPAGQILVFNDKLKVQIQSQNLVCEIYFSVKFFDKMALGRRRLQSSFPKSG